MGILKTLVPPPKGDPIVVPVAAVKIVKTRRA
jgi:hypothetical protein